MRHRLIDHSDGRAVLSGAADGRRLFGVLLAATTSNPSTASAVYLDFAGIRVATSSFLREAVFGFRDYVRLSMGDVYPVVANTANAVAEELEFLALARRDVVWSCRLGDDDEPSDAKLVGELDPAQRATFEAAVELRTVTAASLAAKCGKPNIGPTAWNNRLAALAAKGVLVEHRSGKSKSFTPLLETA